MKVARFDFGIGDIKEWFANNCEAKNIKLVGKLPLDKIEESSKLIMESDIVSVDLSECENARFYECEYGSEEECWDDYANYIIDRKGGLLSPLAKMFLNKRYSTSFVIDGGMVFSDDRKVIVHQPDAETIKISEGVEVIGRWAFANYTMSHISLPDGLKEFGDCCMELLDNLSELKMPDSVVKLGFSSFCYSSLESVKVADGIEVFPSCCFRYCAIDNIPKSLRIIEEGNCFRLSGQENAVLYLPEGFESIGSYSINGYEYSKVIFPSSTNFIAKDFWYDEIVGADGKKPKIVIPKENPFYSVDKKNNVVYNYVSNEDIRREFSRKAIEFVESETERKYLLDKDVVLSPLEMINLVGLSPERGNLRRIWFFNELYDTNILTAKERKKLVEEINYCKQVWHSLHTVDKHKKFRAYGVLFNYVDEKTGKSFTKEERFYGIYDHSFACMQNVGKNAFDKYDKVVCRQYYCKGKKIDEESIGYFELYEPLEAINNVVYASFETDRPYIDLPYPFEPGDIVKLPHYDEECVVSDIYRPTAEQIKTGFVDSYDMAVTVLPVKYAKKVRECISQNKPIPEKIREKHDHWSFLQMEMVEKFSDIHEDEPSESSLKALEEFWKEKGYVAKDAADAIRWLKS